MRVPSRKTLHRLLRGSKQRGEPNMARSLKERYEAKQVEQLKERISVIDRQLLEENHRAHLIVEALDQADLDKVTAIVQKLDTIKNAAGNDLQPLTTGIEQALAEINKFTGGGPITNAWAKLKSKVGIDNPVVKISTFANALEQGFKQLPQILQNNGINPQSFKDTDVNQMTLLQAIQAVLKKQPQQEGDLNELDPGKATAVPAGTNNFKPKAAPKPPKKGDIKGPEVNKDVEDSHKADTDPRTEARIKTIVAQIRKALSPSGIFGAFKKVPYVSGDALAQAMLNTPVPTLVKVSNAVKSGAQTADIASDLKQNITGQGGAETKGTIPGDETKPTGQTATSQPAKSTVGTSAGTAGTGEKPATGPGEKRGGGSEQPNPIMKAVVKIAGGSGVDKEVAAKVVRYMAQKGLVDLDKLRSH